MHIKVLEELPNTVKYPKWVGDKLFGIEPHVQAGLTYFNIVYYDISQNFILSNKQSLNCGGGSYLVHNAQACGDKAVLYVENKSISETHHGNVNYKYKVTLQDTVNVKLAEYVPYDDYLLFLADDELVLGSKIENEPDNYWGKYLFTFYRAGESFRPTFDSIVDYSKDKGHLLHYIEKRGGEYLVIFSIRHLVDGKSQYKLYYSHTTDFEQFHSTRELTVTDNVTDSQWYCYPCVINRGNDYYVLLNQDDFGKSKQLLLGKLEF